MKSIIAAKMSAIRKRSALSSSAASAHDGSRDGDAIPKEPSSHHGKMRVVIDESDPTLSNEDREEAVDIVLCVALDAVHAVTDIDSTVVFEATYASIKQICWDHTECSLRFVLNDGTASPLFIFATTLVEVETQLTTAIRAPGVLRLPEQVYVGVLVGRNLPSSPIQQRRASVGESSQLIGTVPATKRRELLAHERPPRHITPRETVALQFFKTGCLLFPCAINGEPRGLKLDSSYLYVFPSPDCYDRTACLFSYLYDQVDSCEVRGGTRLELRFHRSGAKQPTFFAVQAPNAQNIRDAIWFFQHDMPLEVSYRRMTRNAGSGTPRQAGIATPATPTAVGSPPPPVPQLTSPRRRCSITAFRDEGALLDRIHSRCVVIGCQSRCTDIGSIHTPTETVTEIDANGGTKKRMIWYCDEHAPPSSAGPGSPPRSPSKRSGLLSRAKSSAAMTPLVHTKSYFQSVRCHGMLQKSGGKYQLTKTWSTKIVALIETPVGGLLVYYDKLAHCPGLSDTLPKERRVIDLSSVMCIRRESSAVKGSASSLLFAFDVVTVYRTWSFATSDRQEYEAWLHALSDTIEKYGSMAPDKALRFPVKCLRDPFQNLPSRSDGSTALEISSNGVTVCSGSDGESEVYNWYFTDIQKWSVAKQNENTCCFLSCVSTGILENGSQGVSSSSASVISTYHDFLFQTTEAEAICSAIEFFVGKCMAKLEVLATIFADSQSRQTSRRPSVEPTAAAKPPTRGVSGVKSEVASHASKQHALEPVQLRPVGIAAAAHDSPASALATNSSQEKIDRVSAPTVTSSEVATEVTAASTMVGDGTLSEEMTSAKSKLASRLASPLQIDCSYVEIVAETSERVESVGSGSEIVVPASALLSDEVPAKEAESNVPSPSLSDLRCEPQSSEAIVEANVDLPQETDTITATCEQQTTTAPQEELVISPAIVEWSDEGEVLVVAGAVVDVNAETHEADSDRFESFEYCECTIGTDAADQREKTEEEQDEEEEEEDSFLDARCEGFDASELSAVVLLDGFTGSDEDSLVLLEDEETSAFDGYSAGDQSKHLDADDELVSSCGEQLEAMSEAAEDEDHEKSHGLKIAIPAFTLRRWSERVEAPASEYNDTLDYAIVYTVRFRRGRLLQRQ